MGREWKGAKIAQNEIKNYICNTPYLRNSIAYDQDFWYTFVKQWYLLGVFSKFWFFGLLWGKRAKNHPKWQKLLSVVVYISGIIHHMIVIYGTYVYNDNISCHFVSFFKIFIFWVFKGVKWPKMVQNHKKLCRSHSICQEPCIKWS